MTDSIRAAVRIIDRIIRGTRPTEIPVKQPTKFELAINLKNTKAITFAVPQAILTRAKLYRLSAFRPTLPNFSGGGNDSSGGKTGNI